MKLTTQDGRIYDGTPEEIAKAIKLMDPIHTVQLSPCTGFIYRNISAGTPSWQTMPNICQC